jgi:hypothetical protein
MSFFGTGVPAKGHSRFGMRVGSGMEWVAKRLLLVPRRDAGVSVVQAIVEGYDGRVGGLAKDLLVGRRG